MTTNKRLIMQSAWILARQGAFRFGFSVREYFSEALKLTWQEQHWAEKDIAIYRPGIGSQFWMGCVPIRQETRRGQLTLPGMLLK